MWTAVRLGNPAGRAYALYENWGLAGAQAWLCRRPDRGSDPVDRRRITDQPPVIIDAQHSRRLSSHGPTNGHGPTDLGRRGGQRAHAHADIILCHSRVSIAPARPDYTGPANTMPVKKVPTLAPIGDGRRLLRPSDLGLLVRSSHPRIHGRPIRFWRHCPTVWDETRVINEIGQYVTVARRSGTMVRRRSTCRPEITATAFFFCPKIQIQPIYANDPGDALKVLVETRGCRF